MQHGYDWAYREFYRWNSIAAASFTHGTRKHQAKHFAYAAGWKKFEFLWNAMIRARQLHAMTPLLEAVLSKVSGVCGGLEIRDQRVSIRDTAPHNVVPATQLHAHSHVETVILGRDL